MIKRQSAKKTFKRVKKSVKIRNQRRRLLINKKVYKKRRPLLYSFISLSVFLILCGTAFIVWRIFWAGATSDTVTLTSQSDWEAGEYYPNTIDTKSTADSMKIQSGYVGEWDKGTPGFYTDTAGYDYWTYDGASYGADFTTDGTYIYLIVGNRRPYLIRYNPETNTWKQLASAPTAFYYGGSITYDASTKSIFAIDGGEQVETGTATKHMYVYSIADDSWSRVSDAPDYWGLGSSITADGSGTIYAVRGRSTDSLWSYDIENDEWDVTLPSLPAPYYVYTTNGQPLEYVNEPYSDENGDHCTTGCLFTLYGNGNRQFFRYDIAERQWYFNSPTDLTIPSALGGVGYGSSFAYDSTNGNLYLLHGNQTAYFSKYDVSASDWDDNTTDTPEAPGPVYYGGALVYLDGYIYAFKGYAVPDIWRFDITGNAWESISTPAATGNAGENGHMVLVDTDSKCGGDAPCLYVLRGSNTNTFWMYTIDTKTWSTSLSTTNLGTLQQGSSMCWDSDDTLYVLRGNNSLNFYSYSIAGNAWTALTSMPGDHSGPNDYPTGSANSQYGGSITCIGSTVYALKGATSAAGTNHFFKYSGGAWTHLTVLPQRAYTGAAVIGVPNGDDCEDATGCVFALTGNQRGDFYRYDTTAGTWTALTGLPTATVYTASRVYDESGQIYVVSSNYDTRMWRYDITGDSWTRTADFPMRNGYNSAFAYDAANNILYTQFGMATYQIARFTPSNNNYISSATWISATQDLEYVSAWEQLTATHPTPGTSSISFALRTSTDQVTWSDWETVVTDATGESTTQDLSAITSPARRYLQIKVTLTSDGTNTPTLSDLAATYTKDGTAPTNPTISGYSDSDETAGLASGSSYYYTNPYFKLEDASDAHSGIAGYYVRWSDDDQDDPAASEDYYQAGSTYEVNTDLVADTAYYLLVKTKDNAGNVSASATSFTFVYNGISPATTQVWTAQADFEATGTSETNINTAAGSGTSMTLDSVSPGTWMDLPATFGRADFVNSIVITAGGSGYSSAPTVGFTGGGGSGAAATATISGGAIVNITITSGGSNYTSAPTVTFTGGGGSGAAATASITQTAYNDTSIAWDGNDTIYALRSVNTYAFFKYTISTKTWTQLANSDTGGATAQYGSAIVYVSDGVTAGCTDDGGCLFATMGGASTTFKRYDVNANTWTTLTAISGTVGYGAGLVWNSGDYLFATRGGNQTNFYRYTISTDTWSDRATPDYAINYGGTLVYIPNGTYCADSSGCIFATRGGGSNHFWRYDVNANSWSYLTAPPTASPSKASYGAAMVYNGGSLYFIAGYASTDFLKYDILTDAWTELADLPATHYYGSSNGMVYDTSSDTIYTLRMYNENSFLSYDAENDRWRNPTMPHGMSSAGFNYSGLAYDDSDTLYITRGGNNNDFYKYVISTQTWTRLADVPMRMYYTSDLIYIDGYVYALTGYPPYGEAVTRFYRYDPTTDLWTRLDDTPNYVGYGTKLIYDGDHTIYTARGAGTTTYYSYDIDTTNWSTQASVLPGSVNNGGCAVLAEIDSTKYIYQVRSTNTLNFYRCTLDTDNGTCTWIPNGDPGDPADAPAGADSINLYYGGACAADGTNIFVPRGNLNNLDFLVYNIAGDSWTTRSLNSTYYNGRMVMGPNDIIYGFSGQSTSNLERYVQQSETMSFQRIGTWTSQIIDVGGIYGFGGLTVNDTLQTNTSLKYETRTCSIAGCADDANNENWSDWDEVSNEKTVNSTDYYTIDSTPAQYVQIKITFTSDRIYTPTVNDLTLSYYPDSTAPTNPDTLTALDEEGGDAITTGNWYNYSTPYFSWSGAADNEGGIGIQGYCVYFGTNNETDPADGCTPETATTYTASSLSTGSTYYLRIKTKDYMDNTSAEAWAPFTYSYDNVAPSRPTNLQADPSVPSATNSFDFTWTAGSDSGGSPAFEYCYKRYVSELIQDAEETCIASSNTSLADIEALQEGTNYLYIRSKDTAGNYSNSGEYESVAFRFAQTPPSLPLNVEHGAVEGDDYSHTFAWSEPADHAFEITSYCYQINEEPTASYCSNSTYGAWTTSAETAARYLAAFRTPNTQPGTNYFYIVAKDEAGLVDWEAEYDCDTGLGCITFESNTISPNTPQSFSISDASNRDSDSWRLTLGWTKPADNEGSVLYKYNVYRSTDNITYTLRESLLHVDDQDEYAYTDVGLNNTQTYYYMVTAVDLAGAESDYTETLSMKPEGKYTSPPDLVGNPSIQPRIRSALIEWLTEPSTHPASSFVQYGLTEEYGGEQGSSDLVSSHSVTLIDLEPATTYHFRLKWVDQDGNIGYSPDYTLTTNDAPSAPLNLTVNPESGTTNSFTFDWDPPADEGVTIAGYFYSVNNIPTEENTSYITDSTVGPIAAATQQGVNTFYVVAVDDSGNLSYANYASIEFEVYTAAPGCPQNITIVDSSDRNAKRYNITLTWDPPTTSSNLEVADEDTIYYSIYRSEDGGDTYSFIAQITSTGYLDTGLNNEIEYYYKIIASDKAGAVSVATDPVSEIPEGRYTEPPEITELPTTEPDSYSAVITWRTEREASSFVDFGTTSEEWTEEQGTAALIEGHSVNITGLDPETKYYYQVKSIDIDENIAYSEVYSFVTLEAPRVAEVQITDIRLFDAMITWKTNKETSTAIEYGTTTQYGLTYTDVGGSYTFTHTVKLENLADGTTYHVKMAGLDSNDNPVQSDDYSFTTLTFPKVSDVQFQNKAEGETEVSWTTNVPTTSTVEYYSPDIPSKTQGNTALVTDHVILLFGLEDATLYSTKIHGTDQFGYEAVSDELEFTTLEDTTPPIISNVQSESNTVGTGEASKINIIISWRTNEKCTSKVEYGEGLSANTYTDETDENAELVSEHLAVVTGLAPARTYHFRVVSKDKAGNESKSGSYSVLTSRKRESFLQLVIANLEETFSWLGNITDVFQ